jgi:hypothetical protein
MLASLSAKIVKTASAMRERNSGTKSSRENVKVERFLDGWVSRISSGARRYGQRQ